MGRIVCMRYEAYCLHKAKQAVTYTTYDKGTKK